MSLTFRLSPLVRALLLAAALLAPAALAGCARHVDDGTYYIGENGRVPAGLYAAWAAC